MMRELLYSLVALSAVAVTFLVLVTRFALVETTLCSLLSRALRGPSFEQTQSNAQKCRVERHKQGMRRDFAVILWSSLPWTWARVLSAN